jgi:hypothetical protein
MMSWIRSLGSKSAWQVVFRSAIAPVLGQTQTLPGTPVISETGEIATEAISETQMTAEAVTQVIVQAFTEIVVVE